ncbi:MAG: TonB-dependent receptor [Salinivirgaceae bacterium]|nr:TonB-dependent receptor [Salinivirgaceae bacterium]
MSKITSKPKWQLKHVMLAILFIFQCSLFDNNIYANTAQQERSVTGTVTDEASGEPLIGVTIVVKGTTNGTITDIDGKYTLTANENDIIVFSFIGYANQEVVITNQTEINISLAADNVGLDEVIVVGYGTQKKKLNTGATLNMKGEDLQKLNSGDAMSSLQGISPGVSITSQNGQPGAGTKVNIRGIGTIGNSQPLYVVDGVQVENIDYLNPSDIASIDVLKDAASSAIYGSQAANGVILVTTRTGKKGQGMTISYDNYFGIQKVAKDPDMLNAQDYITAMDESRTNIDDEPWDMSDIERYDEIMAGTYSGTDWFNNMVNDNALVQSHALNVTGSSDASVFAFGVSYLKNEGLLGKQAKSDYKRITARMNSRHVLKQWNNLDGIVFGQNLTFTNTENPNIGTGNIFDNDVKSHIASNPLLPIYDENGDYTTSLAFDNSINPTALMEYERKYNENNNNNIVGNVFLEVQPIQNLKVRSSFGITNSYGSSRNWLPTFYLNDREKNELNDDVAQRSYNTYKWILTNTVTYDFNYNESHNFNVVVGQESQQTKRDLQLEMTNQASIFEAWDYAYISNTPVASIEHIQMTGRDDYGWAMSSYFGRLSYDFQERYMLTGVLRRDGSTNFGANNRYATFPSVSAGWIISQESFMASIPQISYLKLRGSWGQNGNQSIDAFSYNAGIEHVGSNYPFGPEKTNNTLGSRLRNLPNPSVKWETSEQTNVGLDFHMLDSRLQSTVEWYNKTTKDWLLQAPVLLTAGANAPWVNGGEVSNKGIELSLKWNDQIGDFKYNITGSLGYNKNEVTAIDNTEQIIHGNGGQDDGALWQGMTESYRAEVGQPIGYFWGYQTDGIIRSEDELNAYIDGLNAAADRYAAANGVEPTYANTAGRKWTVGELKFRDLNGDGLINDEDKTKIGDPNPDFTFGLQVNLDYKNFYFQLVGVGKTGHQNMMSYSSASDRLQENITYDYFNKAFHETRNLTGTMPKLSSKSNSRNNVSDVHIYDADYFRLSNITFGYSFKDLVKTDLFSDLRIFVTGKNLFTFTKYPGMDPEVGWGNGQAWASGIDVGMYPLSKTYMAGLSVKF